MVKKLLFSGSVAALLLPVLALAAYNDVSLTTDAVISVAGTVVTVTAPAAVIESITVGTDNFSATFQNSSNMRVHALAGAKLTTDAQAQIGRASCRERV